MNDVTCLPSAQGTCVCLTFLAFSLSSMVGFSDHDSESEAKNSVYTIIIVCSCL